MTQIPDYIKALAVELNVRPGTRREGEDKPGQSEQLPSQAARDRMIKSTGTGRPAGGDNVDR